jgi:hypothetical protein
VDNANAAFVERFKGLCAYALATGGGDAGVRYLYDECAAFDNAKGDFELRQRIFDTIGTVADSVATAWEGKKHSSSGSEILEQFEAIQDDEARAAFHKKHREAIMAAHDARNGQQS